MADRELEKLLRKIDLTDEYKILGSMMKKQVRKNLANGNFGGPPTVSSFTRGVKGRSGPSPKLFADIANMQPRIKKRGVSVGPSRAKKFFALNMLVKGRSNQITNKQSVFLRALGVRSGVFDQSVMFRSSAQKPFRVGQKIFTPRRDPFHFGRMDLNRPLDKIATKILRTWGFR